LKIYADIDFKRFVYTLHDLFRILSVNGFRVETLFIADSQGDNANNYGVLEKLNTQSDYPWYGHSCSIEAYTQWN
jgi:hypothetical protein